MATLLASTLGGVGLHRFYLHGKRDRWAWLHAASLPLSGLCLLIGSKLAPAFSMFLFAPLILSILSGFLEALVLGLMADTKWDATYNRESAQQSSSDWPLAIILVLTLAIGMGGLIFVISRTFDLFFTGGNYG